jgi:hypothetical protein
MIITSINPNITLDQAVSKFRGRFNELRRGRLRIARDFYIPYRFFRLTWSDGRPAASAFLAADAATGKLDMIRFDHLPEGSRCKSVDTEMVAAEGASEEEAYKLVRENMMRSIFMKGFFKLTRVNLEIELVTSLHIPYWIGVYERNDRAHLEIINALQGRFEGAKLREIVTDWFQPQQNQYRER